MNLYIYLLIYIYNQIDRCSTKKDLLLYETNYLKNNFNFLLRSLYVPIPTKYAEKNDFDIHILPSFKIHVI